MWVKLGNYQEADTKVSDKHTNLTTALCHNPQENIMTFQNSQITISHFYNVYGYFMYVCMLQEVLQNSPDYRDMAEEKALDDFHHKIQHYLEQYEPINPKQEVNLHYIKIMNEGTRSNLGLCIVLLGN